MVVQGGVGFAPFMGNQRKPSDSHSADFKAHRFIFSFDFYHKVPDPVSGSLQQKLKDVPSVPRHGRWLVPWI